MEKSKLVLGTVQLGMAYGINNTSGQPDMVEAFSILDRAWESGINTFDTASAYGTSEEVLGKWIKSRSIENSVNVISKIKASPTNVGQELRESLAKLHLKALDGYMLHSAADMDQKSVMEGLQAGKEKGDIKHIGVSVYEPREALEGVRAGFEYIQIPYNVFDRRLDKVGFFEKVAEKNMTVFARSPFLQGLLLMEPNSLPMHLSLAKPHIEQFRKIAVTHALSPLETALLYVDSHPGISHIIFGVETVAQLDEINAAWNKRDAHAECIRALSGTFVDVDESIVNPRAWSLA